MSIKINKIGNEKCSVAFYKESNCFSGVNKIANKVRKDIERVIEVLPSETDIINCNKDLIIYGTVGKSSILDDLNKRKLIDLSVIENKNEVYLFKVIENPFENVKSALVIAGSDKRGSIYGLFHLSTIIGVSPLVEWANVIPLKKTQIEISETDNLVSKEPSVKYRGFFINDEWPACGNWSSKHFGGFNAKMYEKVFDLLLRMKGNYLWPAMWSARFSDDGPDEENAKLADELGVIMGASHHEPCCRAGEEYKYLRGKDSIYGDAWNFRSNREGITRFWEDGLKRSGKYENVITVGMRGEADTAILANATLKDNINLLSDVLKTQNELIKKHVNEDLTKVPRMLALYKEVEPYFYGDENTKGLINSEVLDGVTLMLCDDNHGNLRTVPTEEMRNHKGGYGMYYHFDYHGSPFSYEWINTSFLPKVKEQMCAAYDFGIKDLWIVNVGDIATNEFPLSYFLNLAYDYEKFSQKNYSTLEYTNQWVAELFPSINESMQKDISLLLNSYTKLTNIRRTECMNSKVFHPVNYNESDKTLTKINEILTKVETIKANINDENFSAFFSQIYYPVKGTMNVMKMQLIRGKNQWYASKGIMKANSLCSEIKKCLEEDKKLVTAYDAVDNGRWYAMGWSEHIGFTQWNEEENQFPVCSYVNGADKKRISVWIAGVDSVTSGLSWSKKTLILNDFRNPDVKEAVVYVAGSSEKKVEDYSVKATKSWLKIKKVCDSFDKNECFIDKLIISIDEEKLILDDEKVCDLFIKIEDKDAPYAEVRIKVNAEPYSDNGKQYSKNTFIQLDKYVCMEAAHFTKTSSGISLNKIQSDFKELPEYGKTLSAMKVFPVTEYFSPKLTESPLLQYEFVLDKDGVYNIDFYLNPSNPATKDNYFAFGMELNNEKIVQNIVGKDFVVGDNQEPWSSNVINNIRIKTVKIKAQKGLNVLKVYAITPCFVLEKIIIHDECEKLPYGYLGPDETFRIK